MFSDNDPVENSNFFGQIKRKKKSNTMPHVGAAPHHKKLLFSDDDKSQLNYCENRNPVYLAYFYPNQFG